MTRGDEGQPVQARHGRRPLQVKIGGVTLWAMNETAKRGTIGPHYSRFVRRHVPGGTPTTRENVLVKWLWSAKPQSMAIELSEAEDFSKRCFAFSVRRYCSH